MRTRIAAGAALVGLVGWIAANAALHEPPAAAQTTSPPIQIGRMRKAGFLPGPRSNRPIFVVAIGSDARPGQQVNRLRADSIHLIAVNPKKRAATILGFPRDSYVSIPGSGTSKINNSMVYGGPELVARTVQDLTGIRIDYWMLTSFRGLVRMIGAVGGVNIRIEYPMRDSASGTNFSPGRRHLSGSQALAFTRDRHSSPRGDFDRSRNQGRLMVASLMKFRKQFSDSPAALLWWLRAGVKNIQTDLSLTELLDLGLLAAQIDPSRVKNLVVPGSTGSAGGASVVFISGSAQGIYRDMRDDGIVRR